MGDPKIANAIKEAVVRWRDTTAHSPVNMPLYEL
jgi:hypothetical protein